MKDLIALLTKMETEKWSGEIEVNSTEGSAFVVLHEGMFLWAHRSIDRSIERFSKITWIDMPPHDVLKLCKTWEELVQALIRSNQQSYHRLVRFLKTERLEIFFRIFFWSNIEIVPRAYVFELPDQVEFGFYTKRKISTQIKEAQRRIQEWPTFQNLIGSSRRIFIRQIELPQSEPSAKDAIDKALSDDENSQIQIGAQTFSPEEIEIIRACDGTNNVQDLIRKCGVGEFLTIRRIIALWERQIIGPKDEESSQHRRIKTHNQWTWKSALSALLLIISGTGLSLAGSQLRERASRSYASPVALQQSLEIFRKREGRYPLNLQELSVDTSLDNLYLKQFQYKLLHPLHYELMVR